MPASFGRGGEFRIRLVTDPAAKTKLASAARELTATRTAQTHQQLLVVAGVAVAAYLVWRLL
jgi:hypothetical protein